MQAADRLDVHCAPSQASSDVDESNSSGNRVESIEERLDESRIRSGSLRLVSDIEPPQPKSAHRYFDLRVPLHHVFRRLADGWQFVAKVVKDIRVTLSSVLGLKPDLRDSCVKEMIAEVKQANKIQAEHRVANPNRIIVERDSEVSEPIGISEEGKVSIEQFSRLSMVVENILNLQKMRSDHETPHQELQNEKVKFVKSLREFIQESGKSEGVRLFRLIVSLAADKDKVLNEYARAMGKRDQQDKSTPHATFESLFIGLFDQSIEGEYKEHIVNMLNVIKESHSFNNFVRFINHYSNDELETKILNYLDTYIKVNESDSGIEQYRPIKMAINIGINKLITDIGDDIGKISENPDVMGKTLKALITADGYKESTEISQLPAKNRDSSRREWLLNKFYNSFNFMEQLAVITEKYIQVQRTNLGTNDLLTDLKNLLQIDENRKTFKFLLEILSEKVYALAQDEPSNDTVVDEILQHIPHPYRSTLNVLVRELTEMGGGVVLLGRIMGRVGKDDQIDIINRLFRINDSEISYGELILDRLARIMVNQPNRSCLDISRDEQRVVDPTYRVDLLAKVGMHLLKSFNEDEINRAVGGSVESQLANFIRGENSDQAAKDDWISAIRNLLSPRDFDTAFDSLKNNVPPFLIDNLEKLKDDYHLKPLVNITHHLLPYMTDNAIFDLLKMAPNTGIELVRLVLKSALDRLGEDNNNLHTALEQRTLECRAAIGEALGDKSSNLNTIVNALIQQDDNEFERWAYQNRAVGSASDWKYSFIPDRLLVPIMSSRERLLEAINEFRNALQTESVVVRLNPLDDAVAAEEYSIDRLLGLTVADLLLRDVGTVGSARLSQLEGMQHDVMQKFSDFIGDLGVNIDLSGGISAQERGRWSENYTVQPDLTALRSLFARAVLAQGMEKFIKSMVPRNSTTEASVINYEDRKEIALIALNALSAPQAIAAKPLSEEEQINGLWRFTYEILRQTDVTMYKTHLPRFDYVVNDDGFRSKIVFYKNGSVRDANECLHLPSSVAAQRLYETYGIDEVNDRTVIYGELSRNLATINDGVRRNVTLDVAEYDPLLDRDGDPSMIIFNADGSIVDENGVQHHRGSYEAESAKQRIGYHDELQVKVVEARKRMRAVIKDHWKLLITLLSENNTPNKMRSIFQKAHLPISIQNMLISMINEVLPPDLTGSDSGTVVIRSVLTFPPHLTNKFINNIPDAALDQLMQQFTDLVNHIDPYEELPFFNKFGKILVASLTEIRVIQKVSGWFTKEYYKVMPHCDKRKLSEAVIMVGKPILDAKGDITAESLTRLVGGMTQAANPCYQKSMQLFKTNIQIPSIRKPLDDVDYNVDPMAMSDVLKIIRARLPGITGPAGARYRLLTERELKSEGLTDQYKIMGSATIAQAHKVYVVEEVDHSPSDQLVVRSTVAKVRKPFVKHQVLREFSGLKSIPDLPSSIVLTLDEMEYSTVSEPNFNQEYDYGLFMKELYTRTNYKGTGIALTSANMIGVNDDLLLQELIDGKPSSVIWEDLTRPERNRSSISRIKNRLNELEASLGDHITSKKLDGLNKSLEKISKELSDIFENEDDLYTHNRSHSIDSSKCSILELRRIANRFTSVSISQKEREMEIRSQINYLGALGDRLKLLVACFSTAAFLGDISGKATTDIVFHTGMDAGAVPVDKKVMRNNSVHISGVSEDSSGGLQKSYLLRYKDRHGDVYVNVINESDRLFSSLEKFEKIGDFKKLEVKLKGEITTGVRAVLDRQLLFDGETFTDSDRHIGNLLHNRGDTTDLESESETAKLSAIDTGAGTIGTEYGKNGMHKMSIGIGSGDHLSVMEGLKHLIPNIDDPEHYKKRETTESGLPYTYGTLCEEIRKSINLELVEEEKLEDLYVFLLNNEAIDFEVTQKDLFGALSSERLSKLKERVLDFDNPDKAISALFRYLDTEVELGVSSRLEDVGALKQKLAAKMSTFDYGRVVSKHYSLTDGENTLLLIKSLTKIANILDEFNIHAPEIIIMLHRGAKFIGDQVKRINSWKEEVREELEKLEEDPSWKKMALSSEERHALKELNIGEAYLVGLTDGSTQLSKIFSSLTQNTNKRRLLTQVLPFQSKAILKNSTIQAVDTTSQALTTISNRVSSVRSDFVHMRRDGLIRGTLFLPALLMMGAYFLYSIGPKVGEHFLHLSES